MLHPSFLEEHPLWKVKWAASHGTIAQRRYLGTAMLYFTLPYMLPAKTAVILGSGGGVVPMLVRDAQRQILDEEFKSRCILIDAGIDDKGFGMPDYHDDEHHPFRRAYPEIEIWKMTTDEAVERLRGVAIDYLHIDADHTHAQSYRDFENYLPLMAREFLITLHDTGNILLELGDDGYVMRTIARLRREMERGGRYENLEMINFNNRFQNRDLHFKEEVTCCGTAIVKPKTLRLWESIFYG